MTTEISNNIYNGFKLISLDLIDNPLMSMSKISYNFIEEGDNQELIYFSVLIGANGTGKSNLFRIIIELFKELHDLSNGRSRSYNVKGKFNLKFALMGDIYNYSNIYDYDKFNVFEVIAGENQNIAYVLKNTDKINFNELQFPTAIVANSIMLTDKYPFFQKDITSNGEKVSSFHQYKYLGVRNIAQNASTRAYVRKTVEFIVQEFNSMSFRNGLVKATKFLGLSEDIEIFYYTSNTVKFFKGELNPEILDEYFKNIENTYANLITNPPYKLQHYMKLLEKKEVINNICDFCNKLYADNKLLKIDRSSIKKISYNLIDKNSFLELSEDFKLLEHLRQLGMINPPEIQLKRTEGYTLQESSSGEYHFFSSIVGLLATVKSNSLVFIDEPEISLHPNWQMQYLSFLRELFSDSEYATSHILIATHSHFLISDLVGENSKIIGLRRENGKISIVDLAENLNTFGWSAEDVLYNVFNVASSRNKFVAEDIAIILNELSAGDINKINKLSVETYKKIIDLDEALKAHDPLKSVVKSILTKISN